MHKNVNNVWVHFKMSWQSICPLIPASSCNTSRPPLFGEYINYRDCSLAPIKNGKEVHQTINNRHGFLSENSGKCDIGTRINPFTNNGSQLRRTCNRIIWGELFINDNKRIAFYVSYLNNWVRGLYYQAICMLKFMVVNKYSPHGFWLDDCKPLKNILNPVY